MLPKAQEYIFIKKARPNRCGAARGAHLRRFVFMGPQKLKTINPINLILIVKQCFYTAINRGTIEKGPVMSVVIV